MPRNGEFARTRAPRLTLGRGGRQLAAAASRLVRVRRLHARDRELEQLWLGAPQGCARIPAPRAKE
jgi:hypothetical protein